MKLIAIDMDGTLVNRQLKVTKENSQVISQAVKDGHHVVIATGRSYDEARHTLEDAELHLPLICVNGAEIRSAEWEILSSAPLAYSQYEEIKRILDQEDIYYELYTSKGTYTDNREKAYEVMKDIVITSNPEATDDDIQKAALRRFRLGLVSVVGDFEKLLDQEGIEVYKFLAFSSDTAKLQRAFQHLQALDELAVSSSAENNLEITNSEAQKGVALKRFAEIKGIPLEHTMAIGDNYNDVSMLEVAGFPVAMGNAVDEVKQISAFVTKENDESGVAFAIQKFLETK
ncbi:Cof-type HAD-IIB family hydrolase [Fictibacillus phosphorivorans]|uniref:Cof-type HAD-IIB family hydrolase n=1 Tax=Fictibacillus phosphorivorans TaxID=1221500 RepID=UPI0020401044|nr:Cof-type HAD-IIB family hydrolase [Fictibacillus phosphorivorans]MCM3717439.1 Cof-type HAD-IIB family hydrolase [Fictibacillus phosphorivorans]MCM3775134.1 Cof-type HAD-IIB family hydrolase [Fictibacillus phosphorivorans]